ISEVLYRQAGPQQQAQGQPGGGYQGYSQSGPGPGAGGSKGDGKGEEEVIDAEVVDDDKKH
ncbi:MAG: hypothetical protein N2556_09960, partial [Anaerolineae bacterium]|nr:hypothetical protein [Anaerolineae bacterium]